MKVFADTSYFIALLAPRDQWHALASEIARQPRTLITTQFVILGLASHFSKPPLRAAAIDFVESLSRGNMIEILGADAAWVERGWEMFKSHDDKSWSLIDCISFVLMREHGIAHALTADHHFEQAGFSILLKDASP